MTGTTWFPVTWFPKPTSTQLWQKLTGTLAPPIDDSDDYDEEIL